MTGSEVSAAPSCARCRRPLVRRGPQGECLRCLVNFASFLEDEDTGTWTEDLVQRPRRYGHFEILTGMDGRPVELGAGAMATTYRARDTVLHAEVALKVINRRSAGSPAARARFLREARTAAGLDHPNIAGVTFYGEQDGECYYVMQLVEGETLEARVRREGPLPVALALGIGVQVARALAAAEAAGIIHRDLKPSNVMLVATAAAGEKGGPPAVKVIDWGLAKAATAEPFLDPDHTRGGFVGTPAFASPEQFAPCGEERVDIRADIYSLGVTLWYLLCGRAPFLGHSLEAIHAQQTAQPLPLAQLAAHRVPAPVVRLLRRLLAADPRDRVQSARELLAALASCGAQIARVRRRRAALLGAAALVLAATALLAGTVGKQRWQRQAPPPVAVASPSSPRESVAVLPFHDDSDAGQYDFFVKGVQDEITGKLARVAALKIVSILGNGSPEAGLGAAAWAGYVLEGRVRRTAEGNIRVVAVLRDARHRDRPPVWQGEYDRPLAGVFTVESEIVRGVLARLAIAPSPEESALIAEQPTADLEAYDLYWRSGDQPAFVQGPEEMRQALRRQIALLEQALAHDPKFVAAHCALATAHDEFALTGPGPRPEDLVVDHRAIAEAELQTARRLRPDSALVHAAFAYHFHTANHDDEQARVEAELARRTLPNDAGLHQLLGNLARVAGRWDEAVRELQQAARLGPDTPGFFNDLTGIYRATRRYTEADEAGARFVALTPNSAPYENCVVRATGPLEQRGDLEPLRAAVAALDLGAAARSRATAPYDECRLMLAWLARDPAGIARVLAGGRRDFGLGGFVYPAGWFAAQADRMRGDERAAQAAFAEARAAAAQAVAARAGDPCSMSILAMIDAELGHREDAVREGHLASEKMHAERSASLSAAIACNLAAVYARTGQADEALELLGNLAGRGAARNWWYRVTYGDLLLNPAWDPLRGDPRFWALLARMAPSADKASRP